MVKEDLSILDKFKLLKDVGFDGVELETPNTLPMKEVLQARDKMTTLDGNELATWFIAP